MVENIRINYTNVTPQARHSRRRTSDSIISAGRRRVFYTDLRPTEVKTVTDHRASDLCAYSRCFIYFSYFALNAQLGSKIEKLTCTFLLYIYCTYMPATSQF